MPLRILHQPPGQACLGLAVLVDDVLDCRLHVLREGEQVWLPRARMRETGPPRQTPPAELVPALAAGHVVASSLLDYAIPALGARLSAASDLLLVGRRLSLCRSGLLAPRDPADPGLQVAQVSPVAQVEDAFKAQRAGRLLLLLQSRSAGGASFERLSRRLEQPLLLFGDA
eukprot:236165-Hanusia_phi.AAC.1